MSPNSFEFDVEQWTDRFPLENLKNLPSQFWGGSPIDLARFAQVREWLGYTGPSIRVDVCAFCKGEPDRRDCTKIGGLPYRPRDKPWPTNRRGEPLTFLAQFRLIESSDFLGKLPGEFLLVFTDTDELTNENRESRISEPQLMFEWQGIGCNDLVDSDGIPPAPLTVPICWAQRYRTTDSPFAVRFGAVKFAYQYAVVNGMKVGGWSGIESVDEVEYPIVAAAIREDIRVLADQQYAPARHAMFLGQIGPLFPNPKAPWCNLLRDPDIDRHDPTWRLAWADTMSIRLFCTRSGETEWVLAASW